ncbi:MAG: DUF2059 domain-containing protein [Gammaproteobacteria bacterium]|nr:DUF2059 domain-containing protein [Gammaproteobacteria bacterium]
MAHRRCFIPCVTLVALSFYANLVLAQASDAAIDELMRKSGIAHLLDGFASQVEEGFASALAEDPQVGALLGGAERELRESAREVFASHLLTADMQQTLAQHLSTEQADETIAWLDSPLGQRITALENASTTTAYAEGLAAYAANLADQPPAQRRLALLGQLDQAANVSESSVQIVLHMQLALALAVAETLPEQERPTAAQLLQQLESERPAIEQQLRQYSLLSLLFTYRDVADDELEQYIGFLMSPPGAAYQAAALRGLDVTLTRAVRRWGNDIGRILNTASQRSST